MTTMLPVRWGILGAANIALKQVIPGIQKSGSGTVVAIASRSADKAEQAARELGIPRAHGSYEALLADEKQIEPAPRLACFTQGKVEGSAGAANRA